MAHTVFVLMAAAPLGTHSIGVFCTRVEAVCYAIEHSVNSWYIVEHPLQGKEVA